jgi:hypothetical protein
MSALIIGTFLWGTKYGPEYVERLRAGVARHLRQPYRWEVFAPEPEDMPLTERPGCLARLRMFSPAWQAKHGIEPGDRLVCMDLDSIVTGPLDHLFDRPEPFVILQGANSSNPCPYNGSLILMRGGAHSEVWARFTPKEAAKATIYEFFDDQAFYWHIIPNAAGWKAGKESGVYAFRKRSWPSKSDDLPPGASLVAFPGWRDPSKFTHLPWVQEHWR